MTKQYKSHNSALQGTATRPRLSVFRSNRQVYAQAIDDSRGITLFAASSDTDQAKKPVEEAYELGQALAALAKEKKTAELIFDRGSCRYHGQVRAVAEGIRSAGIKI